jgi:hypothetical protein
VALRIVLGDRESHSTQEIDRQRRQLGRVVATRATLLQWPAERRPRDERGHAGLMHVKAAVADSRVAFLTAPISQRRLWSATWNSGPPPGRSCAGLDRQADRRSGGTGRAAADLRAERTSQVASGRHHFSTWRQPKLGRPGGWSVS